MGKEKVDDFIGRTFPTPKGGILTVVGICENKSGSHKRYLCECSLCSKDTELFPELFSALKGTLRGSKKHKPSIPCGCSKHPTWSKEQFTILVKREAYKRGYVFIGYCTEFVGCNTKIKLHNPCTKNTWKTTSIERFLNGTGDPVQGYIDMKKVQKMSTAEREKRIGDICSNEGLTFLGWVDGGYVNNKSKLKWLCKQGHLCENTTLSNFLNGKRCPTCNNLEGFNGYYKGKAHVQDYLYVIDLCMSTKVGRSFEVAKRVNGIRTVAGFCKSPAVEQLYTATHQVVYDTEQEILATLRQAGYQYKYDWTNEAFYNECKDLLQERLDYYVSIGTLTAINYEGK